MDEIISNIPLDKLKSFPNHPFKVREDDSMRETVESIRTYGVLVAAVVRPTKDGDYEILSGHRRKHACGLAGRKTIPAIVSLTTILPLSSWLIRIYSGRIFFRVNVPRRTR